MGSAPIAAAERSLEVTCGAQRCHLQRGAQCYHLQHSRC
eukprot:COSAG06_NODE_50771_length_316_cov_0.944700_1_plen_38_part_01